MLFHILPLTHAQRVDTSFIKAAEQAEKATPVAEGPPSSQIPPSSSTSSVAGVEDQLIPDHSNLNSPIESLPSHNAKAQSSEPDGDSLEKMKALVTDEVCAKNLSLAKEQLDAKKAEEEMLAKLESGNVVIGVKRPREDGDGNVVRIRPLRISALEQTERSISTSPDKIPPRAPKAMIEQARVLDRFDSMSMSILLQCNTSSLSQEMEKSILDLNNLEINEIRMEMSFGVVVTVVETQGSPTSIPSGRKTIVSHLGEKEAMTIRHESETLTRRGRQAVIETFHRPHLRILATLFLVYGLLKRVLTKLRSLMWTLKCIQI